MNVGEQDARRRPVVGAVVAALAVLAASVWVVVGDPAHAGVVATFSVRGSVNQVATWGHPVGATVELHDGLDALVASGVTDAQGAFLFREVAAGPGYSVVSSGAMSPEIAVTAPTDHPDASFYDAIDLGPKPIGQGNLYTYIPTRDGTLLSANIVFPSDGTPGPWPVVVNYSGYSPSSPPNPPQESLMFPPKGYVTVGVNMRGTGCSGGAFDIFEMLQSLDGYDVIETLARQSWSNGNIGMVGISYPGISQLFVAQTQPPSLDAITPLSVYDDFYRGIGYPGGLINTGFFLDWLAGRNAESEPAAAGWAQERIENGDTTCADNQVLRLQSQKTIPQAVPGRFYENRGDYLSPATFVDQIDVPVFLSGAYQDEQTGGHWATMVDAFDPDTPLRVQLTNGTHVESLGPEHLNRYLEFVDFYVGRKVPSTPPILTIGAPIIFSELFGTPDASLPPDRFTGQDYATALAAYEAEPPVRVYWENGAGRDAGEPFSTVQADYDTWPLPGTTAQSWYFQPDGELATTAPTVADGEPRGISSYAYDPTTKDPKRTFDGGTDEMWKPLPEVDWKPLVEGSSLNFVSEPFAAETAFAGWGSADLWLRSTEADTDVEVTITEVRPDGNETFVQSGWLRASRRAVDLARSDELMPYHTHLEADAEPLPEGEFALARVEMFPFAHVVRAGSKLRINVEVPGGNQPFWQIDPMAADGAVTNEIAHSAAMPSKIVLPLVPAAATPDVPDALPPCPGLRGQACRDYLPAHIVTDVTAEIVGDDIEVGWTPPPVTEVPEPDEGAAVAAIAPDAVPTGFEVAVAPTGETFEVEGDATTFTYPGAALDTPFTFTVTAQYTDGIAPRSNASLAVVIQSPPPSTTTTTSPDATTSTTAPATTSTTAPGTSANAAVAVTTSTTGSLPVTGVAIAVFVIVGGLLLAGGIALAVVARRRS